MRVIFMLELFLFADSITPANYSALIGPGFATNWFKAKKPLKKYHENNIQDVYDAGFRNLRIRCRADVHPNEKPLDSPEFVLFLQQLEKVVDKCITTGIAPIITWIHHKYEGNATELGRQKYVAWWTAVANHLKNKDHTLAMNLFTEIGDDSCNRSIEGACDATLRNNPDLYNTWTSDVVSAIRGTGGNNTDRILILASPRKTANYLYLINETIYANDSFIMVEAHIYASGAHHKEGSPKHWVGNGSVSDRQNVQNAISAAQNYTAHTGLLTYFGAWMPQDNKDGSLTEAEVINFAKYFVEALGVANMPWSLNVLDVYYETEVARWRTEVQTIKGQELNMSLVLDQIKTSM